MNEENENQPAPLETQSASPEQRHPRPRRRFPRRRYRGDRFRPDNSEKSPNSSSTNADNAGADVAVETLDQPGLAEKPLRALAKPANRFKPNRNSVRASLKSPAKGSAFCAIQNAILSRRHRISLSRPKLCAASPCATACGSTAKSDAAAVARN